MVVSGINNGHNLGSDVFYSGTVAAAAEAALRGTPAVALSQVAGGNFARAAHFAAALVQAVLEHGLPKKALLNVNFPQGGGERYRWTRLGERVYRDQVEERNDLRGRTYYWIGGPALTVEDVPTSDGAAVQEGLVSVTPLRLDLNADDMLNPPPSWLLRGYEAAT
jgi:5'-nucleotidase